MESTEWIDSWLRSFCGNSSGLLLALLLLVLLDYITGICVAIQTKQLSSQIGAKGITKKVAMFVVIAFVTCWMPICFTQRPPWRQCLPSFICPTKASASWKMWENSGFPYPKKSKPCSAI